ncbi:MAG: NYN domain-containing protein [Patescibacteria group bacterium]
MPDLGDKKKSNNVAYIDGANLHKGIGQLGWELDYRKFRVWLAEKHAVRTAYLFLGLIPRYSALYTSLQEAGYVLIFKETVCDGDGKPKGNCDADLVLRTVVDVYEGDFDAAILVTSDGDYAGLVKFLQEKGKIRAVLSPSIAMKCSILLKRTDVKITYLDQMRHLLCVQKEKAPGEDGTSQGSLS